ncbi:MAG TPA: hypothetical protein VFT64_08395 [Rickettsiales bacterium]|nr:hypothetical protein [Rickettsiales bacterium]
MQNNEAQLNQIINTMREHGITLGDIERKLSESETRHKTPSDIAMRVFTSLGAIFILSGLFVYTEMFWKDMSSFMRIFVSLGTGIGLSMLAAIAMKENKYPRLIGPLIIIAAAIETTGWFVTIYELFPHTGEITKAVLAVYGIMGVQQALMFAAFRKTSLAFTALFFAYGFSAEWLDWLGLKDQDIFLALGICMIYQSYVIARTIHRPLSSYGYFIGACMFYASLFDLVYHTSVELLYPAVAIAMLYVCTIVESRALLVTSVLALIGFIGYYTTEYFVNSIGWPLALVIMGVAFLGTGAAAVQIKRKYLVRRRA